MFVPGRSMEPVQLPQRQIESKDLVHFGTLLLLLLLLLLQTFQAISGKCGVLCCPSLSKSSLDAFSRTVHECLAVPFLAQCQHAIYKQKSARRSVLLYAALSQGGGHSEDILSLKCLEH